uniref:Y+L amino acid transporter 2 n=1 Tax=Rhabditophanes sp. KR3021 TaxID=114890 RepID=A0AC35U895_9BILA
MDSLNNNNNNDEKVSIYISDYHEKKMEGLKPTINLFGGVMVIVGCIIGSGIFISPKGVHENTNSIGLSLLIWIICGIFSGIGAYCYAELGTFITESGGDYTYVLQAFGPLMGFLRLWIECIIVRPCTITAVSITFSTYILDPFYGQSNLPFLLPQLLAALCIITLAMINCYSVHYTSIVQNVFTIAKLGALMVIILTGMYLFIFDSSTTTVFDGAFDFTNVSTDKLAIAFYSGLWAYNGWNFLNFITEELINPARTLPKAIGISITICTVVYLLVNVAFYAGTSVDIFVHSNAIAITFANRYYGYLAWLMPILVACSCFGTVNGVMLTSSRLFFVGARNDHMPVVLSYINLNKNTPIPAVLFTAFLSLLYLLLSDNIYSLINYVQVVNWTAIGVATGALLWLRIKKPVRFFARPIQVHIAWPILFLLGCCFLVIFPIFQAPYDTAIGLTLMLTGFPVYFLFIKCKGRFDAMDSIIQQITEGCQRFMDVVPIEKQD